MTNFKHPEFHLLHKLQLLLEKYPEMEELKTLADETRDIINENAVAMVQQANFYTLLGKPGDLSRNTKEKLRKIFSNAIAFLDLDDEAD